MKKFSHSNWIKKIGECIEEDDVDNIVKFSLSYTLQSLRNKEDFNRFRWKEDDFNDNRTRS